MAVGLELDGLLRSFKPKPFYGFMTLRIFHAEFMIHLKTHLPELKMYRVQILFNQEYDLKSQNHLSWKDPQGSSSPALKWTVHTGIDPTILAFLGGVFWQQALTKWANLRVVVAQQILNHSWSPFWQKREILEFWSMCQVLKVTQMRSKKEASNQSSFILFMGLTIESYIIGAFSC